MFMMASSATLVQAALQADTQRCMLAVIETGGTHRCSVSAPTVRFLCASSVDLLTIVSSKVSSGVLPASAISNRLASFRNSDTLFSLQLRVLPLQMRNTVLHQTVQVPRISYATPYFSTRPVAVDHTRRIQELCMCSTAGQMSDDACRTPSLQNPENKPADDSVLSAIARLQRCILQPHRSARPNCKQLSHSAGYPGFWNIR